MLARYAAAPYGLIIARRRRGTAGPRIEHNQGLGAECPTFSSACVRSSLNTDAAEHIQTVGDAVKFIQERMGA